MFIKIPEFISSRLPTANTSQRPITPKQWSLSPNIPIICQYVDRTQNDDRATTNIVVAHASNCRETKSSLSNAHPVEVLIDSEGHSHIHRGPFVDSSNISSSESSIRPSKSTKPLSQLFHVTKKLFLCDQLTIEDLSLSEAETNLLIEIVNKKFGIKRTPNISEGRQIQPSDRETLVNEINGYIHAHVSTKRIEENNKFVYKYTFKYLRHQFYVRKGLQKSSENERLFYAYYFENSANDLKMPIENFFDPLYKVCNKNPFFKSINNKYLGLIFSSQLFKIDFFGFLRRYFKNTYFMIINSKLRKFFKKLRLDIMSDRSGQFVNMLVDRFVEKLRKNKKCKLPWTVEEVSNALIHFQSLIYYY